MRDGWTESNFLSFDALEYGCLTGAAERIAGLGRGGMEEAARAPGVFSSITDIIAEARAGRPFILVDSHDRENEGDIVIPAQFASDRQVNFMARHGRGLICLTITPDRAAELALRPMVERNGSPHGTAFTVSIEAAAGVSTGISARDRATTIAAAIDPANGPADLVSPGHVFPLVAAAGGVLARAGHTEASVDIARLAGLIPAGVICEIMNDDGSMARLPDLRRFAQTHGLRIGSIEDLITYRREMETPTHG
jgi:3,4-dihydroxy 2-butanone 4-phosphate synthase/GTP cyclohydrolase II